MRQLSPRLSLSLKLSDNWYLNFNSGKYFQRPPYTMLGYRNDQGELINRQNHINYISATHFVGGIEYNPGSKYQLTIEGFYKHYSHYPFSLEDSVSLASKGGGYGVYGAEPVFSIGNGRAYGVEFLGRIRDMGFLNVVVSYTWFISETLNTHKNLSRLPASLPTAWDNRHILNITATGKFNHNWSAGLKWRYMGGSPYTPYDTERSSLKGAWDASGMPYLNYSAFNTLRLGVFHQLDLRIDKLYFFNKWSLNFYVDIQNLYNFKSDEPDNLVRTATWFGKPVENDPYTDENGIERYRLSSIPSEGQGTILPTVGIIVEF